jgi:1,4-alpha-glucan branching enzyme
VVVREGPGNVRVAFTASPLDRKGALANFMLVIRKAPQPPDGMKVTFALADTGQPVSLIADFNAWDPFAHPLRRRTNGTRSVAVVLPVGTTARFRYLADGGDFFDDPDGDRLEPNGYGSTHTVVCL